MNLANFQINGNKTNYKVFNIKLLIGYIFTNHAYGVMWPALTETVRSGGILVITDVR